MNADLVSDLALVESGYRACWKNSLALWKASQGLFVAGHIGVSLSISVLSMEEAGKLLLIDALTFARPGDHKDQAFRSGFRKHQYKLEYLDRFPSFVHLHSSLDPRFQAHKSFGEAVAISLGLLVKERYALTQWIGRDPSLVSLDHWKQQGFYSNRTGDTFRAPDDVISPEFAQAAIALAKRFSTSIDFHLKSGGIERYFAMAQEIRAKLSAAQLADLSRAVNDSLAQLFEGEDDGHVVH